MGSGRRHRPAERDEDVKALAFAYMAGFMTPFAVCLLVQAKWSFDEWRYLRRYRRAWTTSCREFDLLTSAELKDYRRKWAEEPWRYASYSSDKDRYFTMRRRDGRAMDL